MTTGGRDTHDYWMDIHKDIIQRGHFIFSSKHNKSGLARLLDKVAVSLLYQL